MTTYEQMNNKKNELIRKATDGSVFVQDISAPILESITTGATGDLALPPDLVSRDLGWLTVLRRDQRVGHHLLGCNRADPS